MSGSTGTGGGGGGGTTGGGCVFEPPPLQAVRPVLTNSANKSILLMRDILVLPMFSAANFVDFYLSVNKFPFKYWRHAITEIVLVFMPAIQDADGRPYTGEKYDGI